jgi:hypothetical protein
MSDVKLGAVTRGGDGVRGGRWMALVDLAMEKQHLAKAERDIAAGEVRVTQQAELVEHMRQRGAHELTEGERLLETLRGTLQTWRSHRENILEAIARMEKETPSPGAG